MNRPVVSFSCQPKHTQKGQRIRRECFRPWPRHRPHDGRFQFVTTAKKAGVDEHVIKKIVGHCIDDVAEKSYTKRGIEWIRHFMQCIVPS